MWPERVYAVLRRAILVHDLARNGLRVPGADGRKRGERAEPNDYGRRPRPCHHSAFPIW